MYVFLSLFQVARSLTAFQLYRIYFSDMSPFLTEYILDYLFSDKSGVSTAFPDNVSNSNSFPSQIDLTTYGQFRMLSGERLTTKTL
jgi:hypothetical protein